MSVSARLQARRRTRAEHRHTLIIEARKDLGVPPTGLPDN